MINNRQGGRRRGRGGQRGPNLGGQPGNRQDNRQRGNAAQLLEKYKALARDSQLAGDRVQTEYYLQYADHYFRVLGESRARFEDQRRQRGDDSEEFEGDEDMVEAEGETSSSDEPEARPQRQSRNERFNPREPRETREPRRYARDDRGDGDAEEAMDSASRVNGDDDSLPLDVLPPAIGADGPASLAAADEPAAAPRRRPRTPRPPKGDDDVAPAA